MEKDSTPNWQSIAAAPADADPELSVCDEIARLLSSAGDCRIIGAGRAGGNRLRELAAGHPASEVPDKTGVFHIALIASIAAYFLIFPVYRGVFFLEIAPNESWNAYHQDAALGAGPLYPAADTLVINNYPPLSFYLIGGIASWIGDALFVGRALSIAAVIGLGVVIALIIRQLGAASVAAGVGGVWFVATMTSHFDQFVGMDDPQLIGQFMMACGLMWFLVRNARNASAVPPIVLMVVAGFLKHNIITIPVTVLLWLVLRADRRALSSCLAGGTVVVIGLALCAAIYGDDFIANFFGIRWFVPWRMLLSLGRMQFVLPALVIWALWAWRTRHTFAAQFTALLIGVAAAAHILQWSGDGVVGNSQFDLVIATATGLGLAYEHAAVIGLSPQWASVSMRTLIIGVVAVRLVANGHIEPALIMFDPHYRWIVSEHAEIARSEAVRVSAIPGPVACSIKLVCRMAGKAFVYDDFKVFQLLNTGRMTPDALAHSLKQNGITYVAVDQRAGADLIRRDVFGMVSGREHWE